MKATLVFAIASAFVMMSATAFPQQKDKAENLYQEGLMQMEGRGNYKKALEIFGQILKDYPGNRRASAKSQFQTGVCYEKLGRSEAQRAYEQTISKYPDQADLVAQARARLSALSSAIAAGRGPVAQRVLSGADTDDKNFYDISASSDGRRVAYISVYDGSVFMRDLASGDVQQLLPEMSNIWHYSPRWSPDGNRVAVLENNYETKMCVIKLVNISTLEAVAVPGTESKTWMEPRDWSRDGRHLLCGSDQSALIAVGDGTVTILQDSVPESVSLSPDGRFVAFTVGKKKDAQVYVQPVKSGARQQITEAAGGNNNPIWSPDGRVLAYGGPGGIWIVPMSDGKASGSPRLAVATSQVILLSWTDAGLFYTLWHDVDRTRTMCQIEMNPIMGEARSSGIEKLSVALPELPGLFAWSPDMCRIAITPQEQNAQKIMVYSTDTKTLTTFQIGQEGFFGGVGCLRWSHDGKEVQFEYRTRFSGMEAEHAMLALDVASGNVRQLFPYRGDWNRFSVTPKGDWMSFFKLKSNKGIEAIVIAPFGKPNGTLAAINSKGTTKLDWRGSKISPQGDKVAFARQEYPGGNAMYPYNGGSLWVANSDGSQTKQLATVTLVRSIIWDPSGRFIAYTGKADSGKDAASIFRVVAVATGATHEIPLKEYAQNDLQLNGWSSDGRYIGLIVGPHWESDAWLEEHPEFWVVQGLQEAGK